MLHYVSDNDLLSDLKPWVISRKSFARLLDYLERETYTTVCFEDVNNGNVPAKSVILTFDDCPKHLWDFAIPELQKRNMKAVFYLPTAQLDGYNQWNVEEGLPKIDLMGAQDIEKLIEAGMEVGSHAHNHIMLEDVSMDRVTKELSMSKSILEGIVGKAIVSVAYPYGSIPEDYSRLVKEAGYDFGISVYSRKESIFSLRRWTYVEDDTEKSIRWKMSYRYRLYRAFNDNYDVVKNRSLSWLYNKYVRIKKMYVNKVLMVYSLDLPLEIDVCDFVLLSEVV